MTSQFPLYLEFTYSCSSRSEHCDRVVRKYHGDPGGGKFPPQHKLVVEKRASRIEAKSSMYCDCKCHVSRGAGIRTGGSNWRKG